MLESSSIAQLMVWQLLDLHVYMHRACTLLYSKLILFDLNEMGRHHACMEIDFHKSGNFVLCCNHWQPYDTQLHFLPWSKGQAFINQI